jgi:hypothetical protein
MSSKVGLLAKPSTACPAARLRSASMWGKKKESLALTNPTDDSGCGAFLIASRNFFPLLEKIVQDIGLP